MSYDSSHETLKHIAAVGSRIAEVVARLVYRAGSHDHSKLMQPEKQTFDEITPRLRGMTYGSNEYKETLREFKPAIEHHQKNNRHHPEFYEDGICGMSLVDIVEMLCDWKAASQRHDDGDILKSIAINADRFGMDGQIVSILQNTVEELGWGRQTFDAPQMTEVAP